MPAERLVLAPDCGMKYLPRDSAFGKLAAMTAAAALLRAEFGSSPDRPCARNAGTGPGLAYYPAAG